MGFERNEISTKAAGGTEIMRDLLEKSIDKDLLDNFQIIMSRTRELNPKKIRIIQVHDLPEDPESNKFKDPNFVNSLHKMVFISNWQYSRYQIIHGIKYDEKSIILESGIEPATVNLKDKSTDIIRLVYTSTPQRGLEILVPVFEELTKTHSNIHLDVFSSFKIYGWDEADKQFEPLYERIRNHPQMSYHGFTPNNVLRESLNKAHIFAYPCIWLETSCRAMLEAMSAGLVCVHPNYGALPETSGALNVMYHADMTDMNRHANIFANNLEAAINLVKSDNHQNMITFGKIYVDARFSLDRIKSQWEGMLTGLLEKYPTVESRAIPSQQFVYNR